MFGAEAEARDCSDWYLGHGDALMGDEDTDIYYSDDEYEEDPAHVKRKRKDFVNYMRARNDVFRKKAEDTFQEHGDTAKVMPARVTRDGVFFSVNDVQDSTNLTVAARVIDEDNGSRFIDRRGFDRDETSGAVSRTQVRQVTFDLYRVSLKYFESKRWRVDAALAFVCVALGLFLVSIGSDRLSVYYWIFEPKYLPVASFLIVAHIALRGMVSSGKLQMDLVAMAAAAAFVKYSFF